MRNNWIFFVAAIFFIIRLFTKAAKQQAKSVKDSQQDALRRAKEELARRSHAGEFASQTRIPLEVLEEQQIEAAEEMNRVQGSNEFEAAYEDTGSAEKNAPATHYTQDFGMNTGVTESSYKETAEERAAYDAQPKINRKLLPSLTTESYRQFIVAKEIFDRPKGMR